jgi:hypothetical protein
MSTILLEDTVVVRCQDSITSYNLDEYVRWLCLLEAICHIDIKAKEVEINLDDEDWVKPLAFKEYIKERFISMKYDVVAKLGGDISKIKVPS